MADVVTADLDEPHCVAYDPEGSLRDAVVGTHTLDDYQVLPADLSHNLGGAAHFEIADPLSFPFEDVADSFWDIPLLIRLPDLSLDDCVNLFGQPLLTNLTVCDVLSASPELTAGLQRSFGFPRSMFVDDDYRRATFEIKTAHRVAVELRRRRSNLYTEWPLPTTAYKQRLVLADRAIRKAVTGYVGPVHQPRIEVHGWNVRRFVPAVWSGLTRVVERRPVIRRRLQTEYEGVGLPIGSMKQPLAALGSEVVVGIDNLKLYGLHQVRRALTDLMATVQTGGRVILFESFVDNHRPDDFVDLVLDAATHRVTLNEVRVLACSDDEVATAAVFELNRIGGRI